MNQRMIKKRIVIKKLTQRGKKRKQLTKLEKSLQVAMDQFVAAQNETENKYNELEKSTLKESKEHKIEMEERQHKADRQHELQMWSCL